MIKNPQFVAGRIATGIVVRAGGSGDEQKRCRNKKQNSFHGRRVSNVSCILSVIRLAKRSFADAPPLYFCEVKVPKRGLRWSIRGAGFVKTN